MKYYNFLFEYILKCKLFLLCKDEFSASLLQSSVSHDPSEIILMALFPLHGTARYSLLGGFPLGTVPGTFFSTNSAEVPGEPYRSLA